MGAFRALRHHQTARPWPPLPTLSAIPTVTEMRHKLQELADEARELGMESMEVRLHILPTRWEVLSPDAPPIKAWAKGTVTPRMTTREIRLLAHRLRETARTHIHNLRDTEKE